VLISSLTDAQVLSLAGQQVTLGRDPVAVLLASVSLYDQRGGGVETSFKGDKQGLGIGKRNKKREDRTTDGDVVVQPGSQCGGVVPGLAGSLAFATAALWHATHDTRCVSYQWLSGHGCEGSADCTDCAQSGCTPGITLDRSLAPSVGSCSGCHSGRHYGAVECRQASSMSGGRLIPCFWRQNAANWRQI